MNILRNRMPERLKMRLRPLYTKIIILWRQLKYSIRFLGVNVQIHPSAWISPRAIIRCTGGGSIVIGKKCEIHDYAMIDSIGGNIIIGEHCSLNPFAIVYGYGGVTLGNRVRIAAHTVIIPANHIFRSHVPLHKSGLTGVGIRIGNDVWLGAGARILDGVTIGTRSVVGAGAVVTHPIPQGCVATGVPARYISIWPVSKDEQNI